MRLRRLSLLHHACLPELLAPKMLLVPRHYRSSCARSLELACGHATLSRNPSIGQQTFKYKPSASALEMRTTIHCRAGARYGCTYTIWPMPGATNLSCWT
jgi:hypothetical protein